MDSKAQALASLHAAGLSDILHVPGSETYSTCVPRNTEEVSNAVKVIVAVPDVKFAVRSGGHMQWTGANSITYGITIDLGLMDSTTYDTETEIASLQPGGTWAKSYQELEKRTLPHPPMGARSPAAAKEKPLPRPKGGRNNFGIVTRFDMTTFPAVDVWDCVITYAKKAVALLSEAIVDLTENLAVYPDDHILAMWTYLPGIEEHVVMANMMNVNGVEEPRTLGRFLDIPEQKDRVDMTVSVATKLTSFIVPSGKYDTWYTLTFKSDPRLILKSASVFESLISILKAQVPNLSFHTQMVLQPLPVSFGTHSAARGGNMMGLDRINDDCILLVWAVEVDTPELNANIVGPALKGAIEEIEAYARSINGDDPLGSYGEENVRHMREVASKFDPKGIFQTMVPGGFKISKAGTDGARERI
ncbi:hypothetical protein BDW75DRAFT_228392 [Aspergillus navahoensis]